MQYNQPRTRGRDVILFDGSCVLCSRFARFVVGHDTGERFCLAALDAQSDVVHGLKSRSAAEHSNTIVVWKEFRSVAPTCLTRSRAVLYVFSQFPWPWRVVSVLRVVPALLSDLVYDLFAVRRYKWFGKSSECMVLNDSDTWRLIQ